MDVVYIVSPARSGSTFLQFLLGSHPQILGVGEVRHVLQEYCQPTGPGNPAHTGLCSCGAEPGQCSFWGPILPALDGLSRRAGFERVLQQAYEAFPDRILVDSSKSAVFLEDYYLDRVRSRDQPPMRVKILYLVRDFRGWVMSIQKHRSGAGGSSLWNTSIVLNSYRWLYTTAKWLYRVKQYGVPFLSIYYEHLVFDTGRQIRRICDFLKLPYRGDMSLTTTTAHELYGSPTMRTDQAKLSGVVYDPRWMQVSRFSSTKLTRSGRLVHPRPKEGAQQMSETLAGRGSRRGARPKWRPRGVGVLFLWFFGASLVLFMMQPRAPKVGLFPVQVLMIWGLFAWALLLRRSAVKRSLATFSTTQWTMIALLAGSIFVRSMLDDQDLLRLAQFGTGVMIALLGKLAFETERGKQFVLVALAMAAAVSSTVAILQFAGVAPWLWHATKYAGSGYVYGSTGLENSPVAFAYSIVGTGTVLIGAWLLRLRSHLRFVSLPSSIAFALTAVVVGGLLVSNSRSGLLGVVLGTSVVIGWGRISRAARSPQEAKDRSLLILVAWQTALVTVIGLVLYALAARETAVLADARVLTTWRAYLPAIWRNPLGLPGGADLIEAMATAGTLEYGTALERTGGRVIAPHNLLLTTGISYGPLAAIALFSLYAMAFQVGRRRFLAQVHSGHPREALWVLLLIAANVAIISHSWFHNASIAMGEMRNWLWLGLLVAGSRKPGVTR